MKKVILLILLIVPIILFGQSIVLNNIGMYVDAVGDQTGEAGETVHVRVDYTTTSMTTITQAHYTDSYVDQLALAWYDNNDPNSGNLLGIGFVSSSNFVTGGIGSNKIATFDFTIPTSGIPANSESFQVCFGLYGEGSTYYGGRYTSYINDLGVSAVAGNPPTDYYEYIDLVFITEPPTMVLPADDQHDGDSTEIEFYLAETGYDGSVKLSFIRTGEDHECTIVSETQGTHNFTINPINLYDTTPESLILLVTGGTNLTSNVAYKVKIQYQDESQSPVASDSTVGYIYDTVTETPTFDLPISATTTEFNFVVQYDQPETAYEGSVKLTFTRTGGSVDHGSPHILEVADESLGTDKTLSIMGYNLNGSVGVSLDSGGNNLIDDAIYTIKIEYQDVFQNTSASDQNVSITYSFPIENNNLVIVPGAGLKLDTGTGLQIESPVWNKGFITFDGTNYADVSAFVPSVVLGGSEFSISIWKKGDGGANEYIIGSRDGSMNRFGIQIQE